MNIYDDDEVIGKEASNSLKVALSNLFLGNMEAVELAMKIFYVVHVWDDLIDKDKNLTLSHINKAFRYLIYDIPCNSLMNTELSVLWLSTYHQWLAANSYEKEKINLNKAYMLRAAIYNIFQHITALVGGLDYSEKVSTKVYALYGESFEAYKKEIENA